MPKPIFFGFFTFVVVLDFMLQKQKFLLRCLRLKWLFLSIFIVYALTTPGEYVANFTWEYLPTKEGLYLGFMQVAKLSIAISLLGILFHQTKPNELMLGLHVWLKPMRLLKVDTSRFVARLMLTLEYVDQFTLLKLNRQNFLDSFDAARQAESPEHLQTIFLPRIPFKFSNVVMLMAILLFVLVAVSGYFGS